MPGFSSYVTFEENIVIFQSAMIIQTGPDSEIVPVVILRVHLPMENLVHRDFFFAFFVFVFVPALH